MGNLITSWFKLKKDDSKENLYIVNNILIQELKNTIEDLRQDKVFLYDQIKELMDKSSKHTTSYEKHHVKPNTTLTKLESKIYKTINDLNTLDTAKLSEVLNLKETSLKVYISRIKSKGHSLNHLDN